MNSDFWKDMIAAIDHNYNTSAFKGTLSFHDNNVGTSLFIALLVIIFFSKRIIFILFWSVSRARVNTSDEIQNSVLIFKTVFFSSKQLNMSLIPYHDKTTDKKALKDNCKFKQSSKAPKYPPIFFHTFELGTSLAQ